MLSWLHRRQRPFSWISEGLEFPAKPAIRRIGASSRVIKLHRGALLDWVFDEPDETTSCHLLVYLTDRESQRVVDAPQHQGMLEPVRRRMIDPGAILAVNREVDQEVRRFLIPRAGTEQEFVADLLIAAGSIAQFKMDVAYALSESLQATLTEHEQQRRRSDEDRLQTAASAD
ncbi:hypothetical protein ACFXO5_23695, partial [Bacillus subtilis]